MLEAIHRIPAEESAALTNAVPFFTFPDEEHIAGVDTGTEQQGVNAAVLGTSAGFFDTLGVKVLAGKGFDENENGEPAVLVSQSLAARLATQPNELVGHHIRVGSDARYQRM